MNLEVEQKLNDIISYIQDSFEYKKCIEIKKKMANNQTINELVEQIKQLQKQLVKYNNKETKEELKKTEEKLKKIPIYQEYNNYLVIVNEKIELIKMSLNDYFDKKLNNDIMTKNTN